MLGSAGWAQQWRIAAFCPAVHWGTWPEIRLSSYPPSQCVAYCRTTRKWVWSGIQAWSAAWPRRCGASAESSAEERPTSDFQRACDRCSREPPFAQIPFLSILAQTICIYSVLYTGCRCSGLSYLKSSQESQIMSQVAFTHTVGGIKQLTGRFML